MMDTRPASGIKCGNRARHGDDVTYHPSADAVRECYASTGRFSGVGEVGQRMIEKAVSHNTRMSGLREAAEQAPLPEVSVEEAVARMRASMETSEAAKREAANRERYAAWRTIPVGSGDYANYALRRGDGGSVVFFRVERPSEGKWAGKTFVKRYSSDTPMKMEWVEAGLVLDAIARNPEAAAVLYGRETKRCAICHRKLSDDKTVGPDGLTSIQRGIGPKCAQKVSL